MMTLEDVLVALVTGLAVPLALANLAGTVLGDKWPQHQMKPGQMNWLAVALSIAAGPGLLADRLVACHQCATLQNDELALGVVAVLGWAIVYGTVVLGLIGLLFHA